MRWAKAWRNHHTASVRARERFWFNEERGLKHEVEELARAVAALRAVDLGYPLGDDRLLDPPATDAGTGGGKTSSEVLALGITSMLQTEDPDSISEKVDP